MDRVCRNMVHTNKMQRSHILRKKPIRKTVRRFYETGQTTESRPTHYCAVNIFGALTAWVIWNIDNRYAPKWCRGLVVQPSGRILVHMNNKFLKEVTFLPNIQPTECLDTSACAVVSLTIEDIYNAVRKGIDKHLLYDQDNPNHPENLYANSSSARYEDFFEDCQRERRNVFDFAIDKHRLIFELIQMAMLEDTGVFYL